MRLDKYIVACGVASRKEAAQAVRRRSVTVNGEIARAADMHIDENKDKLTYCGEELAYVQCVWVMMNKPQGVISATEDARGQKTVLDLLPERLQKSGYNTRIKKGENDKRKGKKSRLQECLERSERYLKK